MRNLKQYPITLTETVKVLANAREAIAAEGAVGDTRTLVIKNVEDFLSETPEIAAAFQEFLKAKNV